MTEVSLGIPTGLWIVIGIILVLALIAFLKNNIKVCPPNEILIFSGKRRKVGEKEIGYRIIKGGRGFRWPIFEAVYHMSIDTIPIEIEVMALSQEKIAINVKGIANIKIAGSEKEGILNAVERFLGRNKEEISQVARHTLEGSLRGVLAAVSPEEANSKRFELAQRVIHEAEGDFQRLGLVIDTFKIQSISDSQKYLEAIGRKKNAIIQRDAKITEAQAEADARVRVADEKKRASIAEYEAEMSVVEKENALAVKRAELAVHANRSVAKAKVAGEIARIEEETHYETKRAQLNEHKYKADIIVPAQAEQTALEMKAKGDAAKIVENGKATAEAINLMRQEWEKGDTRELFLLQQLPDIIHHITKVVSDNLTIEKLTIVDGGNGEGIPRHVKGLTGTVTTIFEEIKNSIGLDIPDLLQNRSKHKGEIKKELS